VTKGAYLGSLPTPQKPENFFLGWYTAANGAGSLFTAFTLVTADITVHAKWGDTPPEYWTITFNANGGSVTPTSISVIRGEAAGDLPAATKSGDTFVGWYPAADGSGTRFTATTPVTTDTTVYAKWSSGSSELPELPESVGTNELSGKTYTNSRQKWEFGTDGTYTYYQYKSSQANWYEYEQGNYSWDSDNQTIAILPERVLGDNELLTIDGYKAMYEQYFLDNNEEIDYAEIDAAALMAFGLQSWSYTIESGTIISFVRNYTNLLEVTATTIGGCAYSETATSQLGGTHYLLSITYDAALSILTDRLGSPSSGWSLNSNSSLSNDWNIDWVILEDDVAYGSYRLIKCVSGAMTVSGWQKE
jgi:uncharacterized repeat protein (TIGR02543 family)